MSSVRTQQRKWSSRSSRGEPVGEHWIVRGMRRQTYRARLTLEIPRCAQCGSRLARSGRLHGKDAAKGTLYCTNRACPNYRRDVGNVERRR